MLTSIKCADRKKSSEINAQLQKNAQMRCSDLLRTLLSTNNHYGRPSPTKTWNTWSAPSSKDANERTPQKLIAPRNRWLLVVHRNQLLRGDPKRACLPHWELLLLRRAALPYKPHCRVKKISKWRTRWPAGRLKRRIHRGSWSWRSLTSQAHCCAKQIGSSSFLEHFYHTQVFCFICWAKRIFFYYFTVGLTWVWFPKSMSTSLLFFIFRPATTDFTSTSLVLWPLFRSLCGILSMCLQS